MSRYGVSFACLGFLATTAVNSFAVGGPRSVSVDAGHVVGAIRSLQGGHFDPGPANGVLSQNYKDLGIDLIRTHDAGILSSDNGTGDIDGTGSDRIFVDWNADPNDPASYNFGPTDAMIQNIRATGAEVFFRVGRSNSFAKGGPFGSFVPPDLDKYANIVKHVVLHYNRGWANGFHYGLRYFEIWNEPDFIVFWSGTPAQYYELYSKVAQAIKEADNSANVGGPALTTFNDYTGLRVSFLQYVRDHSLPLDFYSFHKYTDSSNDPFDYARIARAYRTELDRLGFCRTKLINSEFGPGLFGTPMLGGDAGRGAFAAAAAIYMQDSPVYKTMSYSFVAPVLSKESLGFRAISMLNDTPARLAVRGGDDTGFAVMAGLNSSARELRIVVANYEISPTLMGPIPGGNDVSLDIPGVGHLGTITELDRRTITYENNEGYNLSISGIPPFWNDLLIQQYRVDLDNNLALVSTRVVTKSERQRKGVVVSGSWAHAPANPPIDPVGAAQGVDLIIVKGRQ